jgi:TolB-like protein
MRNLLRSGIWIGALLIFISAGNINAADTPKKVLILPFNINAKEDLSFLQNGIQDMLATRIAHEDKVVTIGKDAIGQALKEIPKPIKEPKAIELGLSLGADYVVLGGMTVFGESISTDVKFIDVLQKNVPVTFSQFGKNQGDVLAHIDMFAGQVNEKVFGRKTYTYAYSNQQPAPAKAPKDDRRKHPESIFMKDGSISDVAIWKSRRFKMSMRGISVGDVDGDKQNEVVFIGKNTVYVYRYTEGTVAKVKEFDGKDRESFLSVDVADINRNGKAEIFITSIQTTNQNLDSFVLEWNGSKFVKIVDNQRRFYRVVKIPKQGPVLLGQNLRGDNVYRRNILELTWQNGQYSAVKEKRYKNRINVLGIAFASFAADGSEMAIAFTKDDRIHMFNNTDGKEVWKSDEKYGGNSLQLEFQDESDSKIGDTRVLKITYLPQRIQIADIDNDGKNEVLVPKNKDIAGRFLKSLRVFDRGHIEGFEWSELGLTPKWKTRQLPGYISDWIVADFDNDGQDEIVCSVVKSSAPVIGTERSNIIMMELTPEKNKQ